MTIRPGSDDEFDAAAAQDPPARQLCASRACGG
jgi:hypothetical protein